MDKQRKPTTNSHLLSRRAALRHAAQLVAGAAGVALLGPAALHAAGRAGAASASFDWRKFAGQTIYVDFVKHWYTDATIPLVAQFTALTGIKVKYDELQETQYREKLILELASGAGNYDVFMTGPLDNWQYSGAHWTEPLDSYISNPTLTSSDWNFKDFWPSLITVNRWNLKPGQGIGAGPLWALPVNSEAYAMFYRKDIFQQMHLAVPQTWPELDAVAKKLNGITFKGQKISGFAARGDKTWPTILTGYGTIFNAYGAHDVDSHFNSTIASPQSIAATTEWAKLFHDGASSSAANYTWYEVQNAFAGGSVAIGLDADHMSST